MLDLVELDRGEPKSSSWQRGIAGNWSNLLFALGKMDFLVQISISLFLKSYGESYYGKFSEPGFPHNFVKNGRQDLNIGCIDASRRRLQSVLKIGV